MLQIRPYDNQANYRKLQHSESIFHEALKFVKQGEEDFCVENSQGEDYCLHYIENNEWGRQSDFFPRSKFLTKYPPFPAYLDYDEEDSSKFSFDMFKGIKKVWFQEVNEYTVAAAGAIIKHTDMNVVFTDDRINWFIPTNDRLTVSHDEPDAKDESLIRVIDTYYPGFTLGDSNQVDQVVCFHHIFEIQAFTDLPMDKVKYAEIVVPKQEGIGSILSVYKAMEKLFGKYGVKVEVQSGSSRYPDRLLIDYFDLLVSPEDANKDNTVYLPNFFAAWWARLIGKAGLTPAPYTVDCLSETFRKDLEAYAEAVIGDKRMLGVLLRGTDYFTTPEMKGIAKPVDPTFGIPYIRKMMEEENYDGIVLATEDVDMLNAMKEAFGSKLIAISQERYNKKMLEGVGTIGDLERETLQGKAYEDHLTDITVNYFYAVYLLSRCDGLVYSNICGGEKLAHMFRQEGFANELCLAQVAMEEK